MLGPVESGASALGGRHACLYPACTAPPAVAPASLSQSAVGSVGNILVSLREYESERRQHLLTSGFFLRLSDCRENRRRLPSDHGTGS